MDRIKRGGRGLSLRKSLILYVIVFAVIAIILSVVTAARCDDAANKIQSSYSIYGEKYYLTNERGEQLGNGTVIGNTPAPMSGRDEAVIALLEHLPTIAIPIYSGLSIMAASLLFYRNKLKKPLAELRTASERISNNDLDFAIEYKSKDELGQLCRSFEIMRAALAGNFTEMWRQVEERKQLNAAFAHDLRTPLTVLKGYQEMLEASGDTQTQEIAATMGKHIYRMERYVSGMSKLRRMEDTQPDCKPISMRPLLDSLYESAKIVCTQNGKKLILQNGVPDLELCLDSMFIAQVCNNLISNAVRYARTAVTLLFTVEDALFLLSVSDDGKGFDKNSVQNATAPYFTEETNHAEHFGLGLTICKLLCEHHGGYLEIDERSDGAKVSAYFKSR